ncbi:hypothetical protein [Tahibacter amnicola]|uniref:Uncharacterized protein n=1 Tax=Tahibacter amnicola TaxID=2976241 RepID=A0ABY6BKG0_9GAMM|nr:hypothetical protein [Tahibacter amnicola]UXI68875.1 hypothetical protein N4264_04250 [Tahibacter amnicola]
MSGPRRSLTLGGSAITLNRLSMQGFVTLMTFASQSGFSVSGFQVQISGPPNAYSGHFELTATQLRVVIDSLPVTLQSFEVD